MIGNRTSTLAVLLALMSGLAGCPEPDLLHRDGTDAQPAGSGPDERGLSPGRRRPWSLPLNNPAFASIGEAGFMEPRDLIVGIVVAGQARAYPWWVMRQYHVVNDSVILPDWGRVQRWLERIGWGDAPAGSHPDGGFVPVLVTLCEACSGAAAFVPVVSTDSVAQPLVFSQCRSTGSSAGSYSAVGVYTICDLETHSRWHPFTGKAGSGPLSGQRLQRIPVYIDYWEKWRRSHPETLVALGGNEMRGRPHGSSASATMGGEGVHPTYTAMLRRRPELEDLRLQKPELVLGVASRDGESSFAYTLEQLRTAGGFVQFDFERDSFLLTLTGDFRALAFHRRAGGEVQNFEIEATDPLRLRDTSGTVWNASGEALSGPLAGDQLEVVADAYVAEWSEWTMSHPNSVLPIADRAGSSAR